MILERFVKGEELIPPLFRMAITCSPVQMRKGLEMGEADHQPSGTCNVHQIPQ